MTLEEFLATLDAAKVAFEAKRNTAADDAAKQAAAVASAQAAAQAASDAAAARIAAQAALEAYLNSLGGDPPAALRGLFGVASPAAAVAAPPSWLLALITQFGPVVVEMLMKLLSQWLATQKKPT